MEKILKIIADTFLLTALVLIMVSVFLFTYFYIDGSKTAKTGGEIWQSING